jgi:putative component of toxin-antitoxin plasmid stabilization module
VKTILTTETFDRWYARLPDNYAKRRIQMRIDRAEEGHFGDCKPVGDGVSEMRIDVCLVTVCILCSVVMVWNWSFCWLAAINRHRRRILK